MLIMQKKCKVCGVGVGIPWWAPKHESSIFFAWSSRRGSSDYCSIRCHLIGQAKYTFGFAVFLGVVSFSLIIVAIVIRDLRDLSIAGIMIGVLAIVLFLLSALGFYFKRILGY